MSLSLSLSEELRFVFFYIEDILDIFSYLIRLTRFFSFSEGSEPIKEGPVRGRGHSDTALTGGRNREEKDGGKEQEKRQNQCQGQARRGGKGSGNK